ISPLPLHAALPISIDRLESIGAVEIRERLPGHRKDKPFPEADSGTALESHRKLVLSSEQEQALRKIADRLQKGGFETFLLHGVTGSGKTEVYLRAMEKAQRAGRGSIILIPEISLTPQLIDRLNARFP